MPGTKKVSKRAQEKSYSPVSTFKPNEKLPDDASAMDKAKAQAKKDEVEKRSALLKAMKENNESE